MVLQKIATNPAIVLAADPFSFLNDERVPLRGLSAAGEGPLSGKRSIVPQSGFWPEAQARGSSWLPLLIADATHSLDHCSCHTIGLPMLVQAS